MVGRRPRGRSLLERQHRQSGPAVGGGAGAPGPLRGGRRRDECVQHRLGHVGQLRIVQTTSAAGRVAPKPSTEVFRESIGPVEDSYGFCAALKQMAGTGCPARAGSSSSQGSPSAAGSNGRWRTPSPLRRTARTPCSTTIAGPPSSATDSGLTRPAARGRSWPIGLCGGSAGTTAGGASRQEAWQGSAGARRPGRPRLHRRRLEPPVADRYHRTPNSRGEAVEALPASLSNEWRCVADLAGRGPTAPAGRAPRQPRRAVHRRPRCVGPCDPVTAEAARRALALEPLGGPVERLARRVLPLANDIAHVR